ncbi:hypothetical protein SAMN05444397_10869 [Flavobacterium aquidurense]|uniref:Uncharacterized protein n=1 Tax=Flavobacterium frigidimaris TaxID=262320 RepID=A0ABX4BPU2_FLAFR|nr:hypothetical protein [Flavobacterium frigidimaris]OXA78898.1 hypothetical protein B0A65_11960 [Flavobacterium frigidimaris]SDZ51623.1 hypothetical protein SAMN05444397_10869 [Flavobacterium aquidurense]
MKTAASNHEIINLEKIEKTTDQILKKINQIRPTIFKSDFKLSGKAKEEKAFLIKNLFPKSLFSIKSSVETFNRISEHANFSKLEKEDRDFISGLDKMGFKNSLYIKEIDEFISQSKNVEDGFSIIIEETIYFTLLGSELGSIERKLLTIN